MPISFFAMIGSMGLMGILVNDGADIMVSHLDAVTKSEGLNLGSLIKASKKIDLELVMLTTVSTSAGMIPTIYGWTSTVSQFPLVLAVAGGSFLEH